jgi:hypothetical protein
VSRKFSERRKAAFVRAVAESGNQTLAAERAKVSRSWVCLHRKEDPAFDAAVADALGEARERLGRGGDVAPPTGWGHLDGVELVVRGTGGWGGGKRIQVARARVHQWSPRTEARFLQVLAATGSAKAAYTAVGMSKSSAYAHRRRWPAFAKLWDRALAESETWLEFAALEDAMNPFSAPALPEPVEAPRLPRGAAIHQLHMNKHRLRGTGRAPGLRGRPPTIEAVTEKVVRGVEAIKRARGIGEAEKARRRREIERRRG